MLQVMKTRYFIWATLSVILMSSCDGNDFGDDFNAKDSGIYLNVDDELQFEVRENLTRNIEVTSLNTDWTISGFENVNWLTVSPTSGRGRQSVTITVAPNENIGSRSCNLRLTSGSGATAYVKDFKVTQESDAILVTITNGEKIANFIMKRVKNGQFQAGWSTSKSSQHTVTLTKSFYICEHETTQLMWEIVMGSASLSSKVSLNAKGDNYPISRVSYNESLEFIEKLNQMTGMTFRLPWAAEWEYAAKGGNQSRNYIYSGSDDINSVAWHGVNSGDNLHEVKTKSPNELGLYDMSGNLKEWCADWANTYSTTPQTDPTGPTSGTEREQRGGAYYSSVVVFFEPGRTDSDVPSSTNNWNGFRLAM